MNQMRGVKSRYDFSLDNRQVVLIISGLILVLMLSFLMGTLFGRNLAQMSDQNKQVAAAPAAVATPAPRAAQPAEETASAAPAADSTRADLIRNLESMKVPAGRDTAMAQPANDTEAPASAPTEEAPAPPAMASLNPAGQAASATAPAPKPAEKPAPAKPAVTRPVVPVGVYTIQLASLPNKDDALELVKQLQSRKYDAYMLTVTLPGKGIFFRVRVGHYTDPNQARKALAILQSREGKYYDAWITQ